MNTKNMVIMHVGEKRKHAFNIIRLVSMLKLKGNKIYITDRKPLTLDNDKMEYIHTDNIIDVINNDMKNQLDPTLIYLIDSEFKEEYLPLLEQQESVFVFITEEKIVDGEKEGYNIVDLELLNSLPLFQKIKKANEYRKQFSKIKHLKKLKLF